jgi:transcriptional regulator with XRE-family HTH domain
VTDKWNAQLEALGEVIRAQRKLAKLSLRELAGMTQVSNPYLSQIERGMHQPSIRVLTAIAAALGVSAEQLLAEAGMLEERPAAEGSEPSSVESAIRSDPRLSGEQRTALLAVYRSMVSPAGTVAEDA